MCNTPQTLLQSYIVHDRVSEGRVAQAALDELISNPVSQLSSSLNVSASPLARSPAFGRARAATGKRLRLAWEEAEIEALTAGFAVYGPCWADIKRDTSFGPVLARRTNVDLKDKHRHLSVKIKLTAQEQDVEME
jgi:hypothetical protein